MSEPARTQRRLPRPVRVAGGAFATLVAAALVWFALVAPDELEELTPRAFLRVPVEGLVLLALVLVLPGRLRRVVAVLAGLVLGVLTVLKVLDMGFLEALGRPFDPVIDWSYLGPAVGVLTDSVGRPAALATVAVALLLAVALLVLLPLSVLRLARIAHRHRLVSAASLTSLAVAWAVLAVLGTQLVPGEPVASTSAATLTYDRVSRIPAGLADRATFARAAREDPLHDVPPQDLLTSLRGKDVVVAFVESYGRAAVQGTAYSPGVVRVLDAGTRRLARAGFGARSAFLTSPTFGAVSWLAHSTFQSGLWVDSQQRYDVLVSSRRLTLSDVFKRAGWRTVGDVPSNTEAWPQGRFYDYDQLYGADDVGYAGPSFSYATMPDQYTLSAFHRLELAHPHQPVMAEIDLASSHAPWTPLPRRVPWDRVGDGSVFDPMPDQGLQPEEVWPDPRKVGRAYGASIEYTLDTLTSFVQHYPDPDLVLVVLGDHQPATIVSGTDPGHDVPVSVIAKDPAVLRGIDGWGWQDGLRPGPDAPVWRMDAFRDRFVDAYSPTRDTSSNDLADGSR